MKIVKSAALLLVIIVVFSFSVFNMHPVKVNFYAWETPELPLFLMLIFAFALGIAAEALWNAVRSVKRDRSPKKHGPPGSRKKKKEGREEKQGEGRTPDSSDESKERESDK